MSEFAFASIKGRLVTEAFGLVKHDGCLRGPRATVCRQSSTIAQPTHKSSNNSLFLPFRLELVKTRGDIYTRIFCLIGREMASC